jgi:hypothetical protein
LDILAAMIGPAILGAPFSRLFPLRSIAGVILREWCLSLAFAAIIGFLMYRTWRSSTAKWAWVLPGLWWAVGAIAYRQDSVLWAGGSFWSEFSGVACGVNPISCRGFFAFTVPFIRAISYSAAALFASRILESRIGTPWSESNRNTTDDNFDSA